MKETKEMRVLLNSATEVVLPSGVKIKVFPVPWRYAPVFTRAAEPLFELILGKDFMKEPAAKLNNVPVNPALAGVVEVPAQMETVPPEELKNEQNIMAMITSIAKDHMENLLDLADCCTNIGKDELGYLAIDDALVVCAEVVKVNIDFFKKRLQDRLPGLLAGLLGGLTGSGSTQPQG